MSRPFERRPYRPSGRFDARRMLVVFGLLPALTAVTAAIYYATVSLSWYLLALSIAFAVGALCSFSVWAIRYAHCRNRPLGIALGVISGLGGYICHFHIDHVVRWGAPMTAVQRLPGYITFRMATDTWVEGAVLKPVAPAPGLQPAAQWPATPLGFLNWCVFLFEALTLASAPAATALYMANWPYSEKKRRWCSRESFYLEKESGRLLEQKLRDGASVKWDASEFRRVDARLPHLRVTLWYTLSDAPDDADPAVFLSVGHRRPARLALAEAAALVSLAPELQALAGVSPASSAPATLADVDPLLARLWPVPPPYAGSLYTPWQRRVRFWRRSLRLFGIPLVGAVLLFGGNIMLLTWFIVPGKLPPWILPAYIAALGFPLWFYVQRRVLAIDMWQWHFSDTYAMLLDTLALRPDPLVAIDDSEAIYVELLPRRLWEAECVQQPEESNEGLLRFDWDRGVALFEGETQRIVLPSASILKSRIEVLPGVQEGVEPPYCVLLQVRTQAGNWDLPFFPLLGLPAYCSRDRAESLLSLFHELCDLATANLDVHSAPLEAHLRS